MPLEPVPPQQPSDPHVPGCYPARGDRALEGIRQWSPQGCQLSRWTVAIREPGQIPTFHADYVQPSYMEARTEHPARMSSRTPQNNQEACGFHHGAVVVGPDSYFQGWFCTEQPHMTNMKRTSQLRWHTKEPGTPGRQPTSYWFAAGAHQGRRWTEAHYHSQRRRCSGIG